MSLGNGLFEIYYGLAKGLLPLVDGVHPYG